MLAGAVDLVTVTFPWGSLLRGVLGLDAAALAGVAAMVAPGGHIEVLASVVPSDGVEGIATLDATCEPEIRRRLGRRSASILSRCDRPSTAEIADLRLVVGPADSVPPATPARSGASSCAGRNGHTLRMGHIVLVGLMGSGKSTVAAALAAALGVPLRDSDADIERDTGLTGRDIAARDGIDALHALEARHLLDALGRPARPSSPRRPAPRRPGLPRCAAGPATASSSGSRRIRT